MNPVVDPQPPVTGAPPEADSCHESHVGVAARICWHAFRICQALDASLRGLHDDLTEISQQCDALIEMAIDLERQTAEDEPARAASHAASQPHLAGPLNFRRTDVTRHTTGLDRRC